MILLLLKASIVITILLAFYKFFLEKESFFATNRFYLLACLALTFILPFMALPELVNQQGLVSTMIEEHTISTETSTLPIAKNQEEIPTTVQDQNKQTEPPVIESKTELPDEVKLPVGAETSTLKYKAAEKTAPKQGRGFLFWLSIIYYFGVIVFSLNLIIQIGSVLIKVIKSTDKIHDTTGIIINSPAMAEPCSFFNYIFINPESYDYNTYEQILSHEKIHVQKGHTFDLLLSEITVILLWFNPLAWLFRKEVEKNIEYQTDDFLLDGESIEKEAYQMNLLKVATFSQPLAITTNYNQSLIKQRIIKMSSKKSNPHSYWKYVFVAPLLFFMLLLLNKPNAVLAQNTAIENNSMTEFSDSFEKNNEDLSSSQMLESKTEDERLINKTKDNPERQSKRSIEFDSETACQKLKEATKKRKYNEIRTLLNQANLDCLTNSEGKPSLNIKLIRGLLKNGADVNISEKGAIKISNTREHIRWGKSEEPSGTVAIELKKAAQAHDVSKVRSILTNKVPEGFIDTDGTVNDFSYIKELLRVNASIQIGNDAEITIYGVEVLIDFSDPDEGFGRSQQTPQIIQGNSSDCKKLLRAIWDEDIAKVKELLKTVDPNCVDEDPDFDDVVIDGNHWRSLKAQTPLVAAAREGNFEIAKLLVDAGAKVKFHAKHDETALMAAAGSGDLDFVKYFQTKGAEVNTVVKHRGTALSFAARKGHLQIVKHLVSEGAEVNKKVAHVGTPLIVAASEGHLETVKFLVSKGANIDQDVAHVGTPLIVSSREGHVATAKYLISKGVDVDKSVAHVGTPLIVAAREGHVETVKYLIAQNADINKEVAHVGTPFIVASREGQVDVVKHLAAQGVDVNKGVAHVGTPLIIAARDGHLDVVKYLISEGVDVNKSVAHVGTPLIVAAREGHLDVAKYLIAQKANIDKKVAHVGTPLIVAAREGHLDVAKHLITEGADVDKDVAHVGTPLIVASREEHLNVVKHLIAQKADIDKAVAHVGTPLIVASREGQSEIIKYLIAKGADVNKPVEHVGTPLSVASKESQTDAVEYLRSKGAKY